MSWGAPNSRIRHDYFVFKEGNIDTITFGGHGCGTGIYLEPLGAGESAIGSQPNPLLKNPYSNYDLDLESDSFPIVFKSFYGDSVGFRLRLATYSLPWSRYKPQMIVSETYVVSSERIIENWKNR
jgi:hypothetical protein